MHMNSIVAHPQTICVEDITFVLQPLDAFQLGVLKSAILGHMTLSDDAVSWYLSWPLIACMLNEQ